MPLDAEALQLLRRLVESLERLAPIPPPAASLDEAEAFVWQADGLSLQPVASVNRVDLDLLLGVERQVAILRENTRRFARGLPANNALLWGARGMGKSSLVKAVHATVAAESRATGEAPLVLIEIHREDIVSLPQLLAKLRGQRARAIVFCDDLSFETEDTSYKSLKAVLEGGIEGRPANAIFYATSNRRHLLARDMIENERSISIHGAEAVEEKVSLSDRFGLWLGFHACDQETYFAMIEAYARRFGLAVPVETLRREAKEWTVTRGARSGRVAWQYIQDLAGRLGQPLR